MTRVVDISLLEPPTLYGGLVAVVPILNGIGDTDGWRTATNYGNGTGGRTVYSSSIGVRGNSRFPTFARVIDGGILTPQHPWMEVWPDQVDITRKSPAHTQWSLRALVRSPTPTTSANQNNQKFLAFRANDAETFALRRDAAASAPTQRVGIVSTSGGSNNIVGGNMGSTVHRLEVQVDSTQTPKVVVRLYADDGTTLLQNPITASPTSVAMDAIRFGDLGSTTGLTGDWYITELEVWDNRHGDGTFSDVWNNSAGNALSTSPPNAQRTTFASIPAEYTAPDDVIPTPDQSAWGSLGFRDNAGAGGAQMLIRLPDGEPLSSSGIPLVVWVHGGFWAGGPYNDPGSSGLPPSLRDRLLNAGFGVAAMEYVKIVLSTGTYPPYNTFADIGARHPSQPCNIKLCLQRLIDVHSWTGSSPKENDVGVGFDPENIILMGYSAGSHLAALAALSAGVTDDGFGRDLTLAGNPAYAVDETGATYTGPDPVVRGLYCMQGPMDLAGLWDLDRTAALYGATLNDPFTTYGTIEQTGKGWIRSALHGYFGKNMSAVSPTTDELTAASPVHLAGLSPHAAEIRVACQVSDSEILVPTSVASLAPVASDFRSYTEIGSPANHDQGVHVYPWEDQVLPWLREAAGLDGAWKPQAVVIHT